MADLRWLFLDKEKYDPDHPSAPFPPTYWNRLICRVLGHHWQFTWFDFPGKVYHAICARCSRTMRIQYPDATLLFDTQTVEQE